ncbi:serine/threonine-protein kinase [Kineococcus sp. SYSU DK001]|uniref:hypothetical protein n=1 Tax=Kineococcus sp. SYSU DK001 TaxID=3383122 RepID=UPI003D7E943F
MTTEGWPDDRLTSSDVPSLVRHHAGPADDPDRYELLGEADGADEAWHVLDHRAATGEALFTLAALRPAAVDDLEVLHADEQGEASSRRQTWRERAAGLARVRHPRLAGVVGTFRGPAPHRPGQAAAGPEWDYAVLEQAAGRSVADWLRDDPGADVDERFTVLATAASVLAELHRGSEDAPPLVHGDITPRSLRLGGFWPTDGVRLAGASLGGRRAQGVYTAPEVRAGALPSAASDVFGFGATSVFLLTGMPPATSPDGDVDPSLVRRQLAAAALTAPHPGLADLLLQALSADPAQRPDRLPAWVNGLRAFVEPRPALDPYDGYDGLDHQGPTELVPVAAHRAARSLPKRPVVVVVGALLLATAGTAVAIAAVQQGRLKDVPNPVAIVQPPQESTPVPTTTAPQPATTATVPGEETTAAGRAPSPRRSASAGRTTATSPSAVPTSPAAGEPTGPAPSVPAPVDAAAPAPSAPPAVPPAPVETPTATAPPPVTGPSTPTTPDVTPTTPDVTPTTPDVTPTTPGGTPTTPDAVPTVVLPPVVTLPAEPTPSSTPTTSSLDPYDPRSAPTVVDVPDGP